jgi:ribosomal protein L37AE/L43A
MHVSPTFSVQMIWGAKMYKIIAYVGHMYAEAIHPRSVSLILRMAEAVSKVSAFYQDKRACYVCGQTYTNAASLGMWQCREHMGCVRNGVLTCCGLRVSGPGGLHQMYADGQYLTTAYRGCIAADHGELDPRTGVYTPHSHRGAYVEITKYTSQKLKIPAAAIAVVEDDTRYDRVYRYDREARQRQFETIQLPRR